LRGVDVEVLQIIALQSRNPARIRRVLDPRNPLSASMLPHVIPLLGEPVAAGMAMQALQRVGDQYPGALIDALLNPTHAVPVRRRLARALSACRSPTIADGLLLALDDERLDIRVQCARSLFRMRRRSPDIRFDDSRMLDLARAELARGASDLAHLFTLLSFVVSVAPLRAAYRAIRSGHSHAKGTALEYLCEVLPKDIRVELMGKLDA
jgi:hypothetical protein